MIFTLRLYNSIYKLVNLVFIIQESDTASGPAVDDSGYENSFLSQVK